jgi:uncharacterized membrane protein YphA (DoxX/SURF4 family)
MRVPRPAASNTALSIFAIANYQLKFSSDSTTVRANGGTAILKQVSGDRVIAISRQCGAGLHYFDRANLMERLRHYEFWGFVGAILGCAGGILMILGLFFRVGVLFALAITGVHLVSVIHTRGDFFSRLPAFEMSILLLSLLFIGPGKYSVDKN